MHSIQKKGNSKRNTGQGVRCSIFVSPETRDRMTQYKKYINFSRLFEEEVNKVIDKIIEEELANQPTAIF